MEPISWSVIAGLMLQYGLPIAERVYQKWSSGTPPTQADFDELNQMKRETPQNLFNEMLIARNADPNSAWAQELKRLIDSGSAAKT